MGIYKSRFALIIILLSISAIAFIVFRRFSQMSNLDIENLPQEKVSRRKKQIITDRVEKRSAEWGSKIIKQIKPLNKYWGKIQLSFRIYVGKIQGLWQHEQVLKKKKITKEQVEAESERLERLVREGETRLAAEELEEAENNFIAAISIDNKSASAYRGLGDTYLAKNEIEEARQTYRFLARLEPDDDVVLVKLAEIAENQGDLEEAIMHYQNAVLINDSFSPRFYHLAELLLKVEQKDVAKEAVIQAVELEPQNPKYLDLLIETAIICGDKEMAETGLEKLRMVNPDNQKLDGFKDRVLKI